MTTLASTGTGVEKLVRDEVKLYVRESNRKPGVLVIGAEFNGARKRIALVRVQNDGETATVRTLDGNPREASSNSATQTRIDLPFSSLTDDE